MAITSTQASSIFLILFGMVNISFVAASSCASCLITHPQQKFCDSDYVLRVRPRAWQYVDYQQRPVLLPGAAFDVQYKVRVEVVYKGREIERHSTVFLYSPKNVCNIDKLEMGVKYLVGGKMKGDKMEITTCGIVEKWSDLTPQQRTGIKGVYQKQCSTCRVYGSNVMRLVHQDNRMETEGVVPTSNLWSRQGCFFNPLASMMYGSEDCETEYSYCRMQKDGSCGWEGNEVYDRCFMKRENTWQLTQFAELGLAAWRCREDCKTLPTRKLKWRCMKATRNAPPCEMTRTVAPPMRLEEATTQQVDTQQ